MGITEIFVLSAGLAMDCFAVSLSAGASGSNYNIRSALIMALFFGLFQSGMALLGWIAGSGFLDYIEPYGYWAAFTLLFGIGIKMIIDSFSKGASSKTDYTGLKTVFILAIATSIDALAAGVSLSFMLSGLAVSVLMIGAASFAFSIIGSFLGKKAGDALGKKAEFAGGIVLIGIGIKTLLTNAF